MASKTWCVVILSAAALLASPLAAAYAQEAAPAAPAPAAQAPAAPQGPAIAAPEAAEPVVPLPEGAIAVVNGDAITEAEWVDTLKRVWGQQTLGVMIRHRVVRQAAAKRGITVSDQETQAEFDKVVADAGGIENVMATLSQMGETLPDYRERIKTESLLRKLVEDTVTVADDELQKFYLEQYGRKAEVQVVVCGTQAEAEQVIQQAKAGADFTKLVADYGKDETVLRNRGYAPGVVSDGFFPKSLGNIVITQPTAETIFGMKIGDVSAVIPAGQEGYYVFKLTNYLPARDVKLDTIKEELRRAAREYKISSEASKYLQKLLETADIRTGLAQ